MSDVARPDTTDADTPDDPVPGGPGPTDAPTGADPAAAGDSPPPLDPARPAPLSATASITTFGTLAWVAWVWLATFVIVIGLAVGVGIWGDLENSLWQSAAAGWQRWLVLAAGVTALATFAPMLLTNGVTRAQLASSAVVTGLALAALVALFAVVGYLVEGVVFAQNDVVHRFDVSGREPSPTIGAAQLPGLALEYMVTAYAAYVTGWQVAIGFFRSHVVGGILRIPAAVVPLLLVEALLGNSPAAFIDNSWFNDRDVPLAVTVLAAVAVLAAATQVARRRTAEVTLRP